MTRQPARARAGAALLAALAPVSMLAVDPAGWYPFGPVKWLAVSVLVLAGAAAVLSERLVRLPRSLEVAVALLLLALAVGALVGEDPLYAWTGTPERRFGVVTWVLCAVALVAGAALTSTVIVVAGVVVAGAGVGAVATAEALGWEPDVLDVASRLTGTFGSGAYLGAAAALVLPACVGAAADTQVHRRLRVVAALAVPLLAVALLGSGARAAWVGIAAAAVAVAVARRSWLREHHRAAGWAAVAALVAGIAVLAVTPVGERLASVGDPDAPGGQGRIDEWRVATRVLVDHPLTGVGPEGYRIAFADGVDAAYEREHGRDQQPDRAHAAPLDLALAGGLPALVAWAAVVLVVGGAARRAITSGRALLAGLAAGLVAHVAGQLLLFPVVELEPLAWLIAGIVVAGIPATAPGAAPRPRIVARAVPVALGAMVAVALVSGVTEVVADRRAGEAVDALGRGDHRTAAAAAERAVALRPDVLRLHLLAARALLADERGTFAALGEVDAALDLSPGDPIALLERVRLLVARAAATQVPAHQDAAVAELRRRLADDPHNARLWEQQAILADLVGDAEAREEAERQVDELAPSSDAGT